MFANLRKHGHILCVAARALSRRATTTTREKRKPRQPAQQNHLRKQRIRQCLSLSRPRSPLKVRMAQSLSLGDPSRCAPSQFHAPSTSNTASCNQQVQAAFPCQLADNSHVGPVCEAYSLTHPTLVRCRTPRLNCQQRPSPANRHPG